MEIPFVKRFQAAAKAFTMNLSPSSISALGGSFAGIDVTGETSLTYTAYWACVRLLSETVASLPCITYERQDRGKKRATDHPLYPLLHDEPNPEMDSFSFFETLTNHLVTGGNSFALIDWEDLTRVKAIWIMRPDRVTIERDDTTREIIYRYWDDRSGSFKKIPSYRIWHTPGLGYDGIIGYSPLRQAMQAIGLGLATEKFGSKLFGNGTAFGGFLRHPRNLSVPAYERLKKQIDDDHGGLDKALKLKILEEGMEYVKNTIAPEEAQFLETRKFQKGEMATFFHIPPHMIGDLDRATFSNIEQQSLEFVVYTMRPWLVRLERSAKRKLFLPGEKPTMLTEFLVDGLLRGDMMSRYQSYSVGRNWGWLSANDVLEMENRNGIGEQGDIYMAPANMIPASEFEAQRPKPAQDPAGTMPDSQMNRP